jgi:hypothetical protein
VVPAESPEKEEKGGREPRDEEKEDEEGINDAEEITGEDEVRYGTSEGKNYRKNVNSWNGGRRDHRRGRGTVHDVVVPHSLGNADPGPAF